MKLCTRGLYVIYTSFLPRPSMIQVLGLQQRVGRVHSINVTNQERLRVFVGGVWYILVAMTQRVDERGA